MKVIALFLSLFIIGSCTDKSSQTKDAVDINESSVSVDAAAKKIRIKTVHGDIIFQTFADKAPNTVKRFTQLVTENFYDGLKFHRVIPNFVIQGGDPTGTGRGGSGKKLKAEFSDLEHKKGTVAMARARDIDSADSQFYISLSAQPHLDGKYTIFGEVIDGISVLEKIQINDKMLSVSIEE